MAVTTMLPSVGAPPRHGVIPVQSDPDTAPYWDALGTGHLLLPRCRACGRRWAPPSATCPHCGAGDHDWSEHSGRGRIYSWITVHRGLDGAFVADVPYVVAVVELDEADGARLVGRLLAAEGGSAPSPVEAELPVQTVTYCIEGRALPGFVPRPAATSTVEKGIRR